jgi:hypothetical protein
MATVKGIWKSKLPLLSTALLLALFGLAQSACSRSPTRNELLSQRVTEALQQSKVAAPNTPAQVLACPTFDSSAPPNPSAKGGHRVVLSWKASTPADSKHADAVGYCIYRGLEGKKDPPVLLNPHPYPTTTCTDDMVQNGVKYYYVVRAISAKGVPSDRSQRTRADIPKNDPASLPQNSPPLCRAPAASK